MQPPTDRQKLMLLGWCYAVDGTKNICAHDGRLPKSATYHYIFIHHNLRLKTDILTSSHRFSGSYFC